MLRRTESGHGPAPQGCTGTATSFARVGAYGRIKWYQNAADVMAGHEFSNRGQAFRNVSENGNRAPRPLSAAESPLADGLLPPKKKGTPAKLRKYPFNFITKG